MKFCMLTSFFGTHSFGGDSAYVDRLSRALARRGHEVHVIYCQDAFELVRGSFPEREYTAPEGVQVHGLKSWAGPLSPLWTQQSGMPGPKWPMIQELIERIEPDVVHFHNLSLIGGPGLLMKDFGKAVRLMSAHEHWLVCPMHVLWRSDDQLCDESRCNRCSIASGRPPQLWRHTSFMERGLGKLDRLIMPSQSSAEEHHRRGIDRAIDVLPYFLPQDWPFAYRLERSAERLKSERPYFACAGRLEKIKGFQQVIALMDHFPEVDLRIAGHGGYMEQLKKQAEGMSNVKFEGMLEGESLRSLMRGARAMVVPSLVPETVGYVVLESFAQGRPVIGRNLGALPEILEVSGGGIIFDDLDGLEKAMRRYLMDPELSDRDGRSGRESIEMQFDETSHLNRYLGWIEASRGKLTDPMETVSGWSENIQAA